MTLIELSAHVLTELHQLGAAVDIPFPIPSSGASAPALPDALAQQGGTL